MNRIAIGVFFTVLASLAAADDSRWYVGVSLGASNYDGIADADPNGFVFPATGPISASIGGLSFDGTETAWSVSGGIDVKDWLSFELGYWDLGNNGADLYRAALETEEIYLGARFRYPLASRVHANWLIGLSRADFEAAGTFFPIFPIPLESPTLPITLPPDFPIGGGFIGPVIFPPPQISVKSPGSETGLIWGLGFEWAFNDRIGLDLSYRRHETQVLGIDTFAGALIVHF